MLNKLNKHHDWKLTVTIVLISLIGLIVSFSTSIVDIGEPDLSVVYKHSLILLVGFSSYLLISSFDFSWIRNKQLIFLLYIIILLSLGGLVLFAPEIAGTKRWYSVRGFSIQPSEFAKLAIILISCSIFFLDENAITETPKKSSRKLGKVYQLVKYIKFLIKHPLTNKLLRSFISLIPIIFLTLIQPSLGNTIIILVIWALLQVLITSNNRHILAAILVSMFTTIMMVRYVNIEIINDEFTYIASYSTEFTLLIVLLLLVIILSKIKFKINSILILLGLLIPVVSLFSFKFAWRDVLTPYQKTRITTYVEGAEASAESSGYQIIQSQIAIGSGRLKGKGLLKGSQSNSGILSQANTDFAFASFSEQFGFIGAMLIVTLYLFLISRIIRCANEAKSEFDAFVAYGIATMFIIHVNANIIMNLGLMPVTGIPLPLISYGGSSSLVAFFSLGLIQSINSQRKAIDMVERLMVTSIESFK